MNLKTRLIDKRNMFTTRQVLQLDMGLTWHSSTFESQEKVFRHWFVDWFVVWSQIQANTPGSLAKCFIWSPSLYQGETGVFFLSGSVSKNRLSQGENMLGCCKQHSV